MSGWRDVSLGEVAVVSWGDTSTTKRKYTADGWLAYSASGPDGYLPYYDHDEDGVVISAIGALCGKTWLARGEWSCIKNTMWMRARPELADTTFLYYATADPAHWPRRGAAQPFISLGDAKASRIRLPELRVQRRIAATLRVLDDLIENNRRRIALLEQMAQAIYREWFVHFRYPGYEDDELVDSPLGPIPTGWEVTTLAEHSTALVDGDWIETKDQGGNDYRLLQVSNIGVGSFRETGNFRYITADTFERLRCTEIRPGDILISRMPDPVGRAWLVDALDCPAVTAVDVAILTPRSPQSGLFLSHWLNTPEALARAEAVATGTTRKRITRSVLGGFDLGLPAERHLSRFFGIVEPMGEAASNLRRESVMLATARDLLLPKLVTGAIDVSQLDLDALLVEPAT